MIRDMLQLWLWGHDNLANRLLGKHLAQGTSMLALQVTVHP